MTTFKLTADVDITEDGNVMVWLMDNRGDVFRVHLADVEEFKREFTDWIMRPF